MEFIPAVKQCFTKYVDFKGRAPRSEYWWFILFYLIVLITLVIIDAFIPLLFSSSNIVVFFGLFGLRSLFTLIVFLPYLALAVRRFHDRDKSGWWILIIFIPIIGAILFWIWIIQKGTSGDNQFGSDPLLLTSQENQP